MATDSLGAAAHLPPTVDSSIQYSRPRASVCRSAELTYRASEIDAVVLPSHGGATQRMRFTSMAHGSAGGLDVSARPLLDHMKEALREASDYLTAEDRTPTKASRTAARSHLASVWTHWRPIGSLTSPPLPDVSTVGDGEMSCDWEAGDNKLSVVFYPDGSVFMLRGRMDRGRMVEKLASSEPDAEAIMDAIKWVFRARSWTATRLRLTA